MIGSTTPAARQHDAEPGRPPIELSPAALRKDAPRITPRPVTITYPRSFNARLDALAGGDFDIGASVEPAFTIQARNLKLQPRPKVARGLAAYVRPRVEIERPIKDDASFGPDDSDHGHAMNDADAFAAGVPFDFDTSDLAPQAHMRTLVCEFQRRQRNASLLVAGSIATACVLTVAGAVLVASYATPSPRDDHAAPLKHSTSVAWQPPQLTLTPIFAQNNKNQGEPLLVAARAAVGDTPATLIGDATLRAADAPSSPASVILVQGGRPLALAPLLPQRQARYLLLRGLPEQARLSAGQRNSSGAWMVKDDQIADLTLLVDEAPSHAVAAGDYPIDIYLLGASKTPQSRQRLVLRMESDPSTFANASAGTSWPAALLDLALISLAPDATAYAAEPSPLLARARRLLGEGDIAGARLLFLHLAEAGDGEAAYELARTFDAQVLAELGARGMGSDPTRARGWYEQASEGGNAQATERLKIFASLAD
jgi:TPR repeat protein